MTTNDLERLADEVSAELLRHPEEARYREHILRYQARMKGLGPKATQLLLKLEENTTGRCVLAIDIALEVGLRAGRAAGQAQDLPEDTAALVGELAMMGLDLPRVQRLLAFIEILKLELATSEAIFDR